MKSNKDLTISEFLTSQNIKRAMLVDGNPLETKKFLMKALLELYR